MGNTILGLLEKNEVRNIENGVIEQAKTIALPIANYSISSDFSYIGDETCRILAAAGIVAAYKGYSFDDVDTLVEYINKLIDSDAIYDIMHEAFNINYDPNCCEKCNVPEDDCDIDSCSKVEPHNRIIGALSNAFSKELFDVVYEHLDEEREREEYEKLYIASFLYGIDLYKNHKEYFYSIGAITGI